MERFCCLLTRRNSYKTIVTHCFKCFSSRHYEIAANLTVLSRKNADISSSWRHFKTFSRSLRSLTNESNKSEIKKDSVNDINEDDDFFGLDGSGVKIEDDPSIDPLVKYGAIFKHEQKPDEDKVFVVSYGTVRFDNDNLHYNESETVFEPEDNLDEDPQHQFRSQMPQKDLNETEEFKTPHQMNDNSRTELSKLKNLCKTTEKARSDGSLHEDEPQNDLNDLFNEQYFSEIMNKSVKGPEKRQMPFNYIEEQYFGDSYAGTHTRPISKEATNVGFISKTEITSEKDFEFDSEIDEYAADIEVGHESEIGNMMDETVETMTAFDYVLKRRSERAVSKEKDLNTDEKEPKLDAIGGSGSKEDANSLYKLDSKGFRIYKDQVIDLENVPEMDVMHLLKNSVLYDENDIVAISKPYGLQCHPGAGHRHSLTKYLPQLAKFLCRDVSNPELYTVHRLDIDTTGVLLLAKTQEMAKRLHDMLVVGKIGKTYWALTKFVPSPSEGIVDIPMAEGSVDGKTRMVLRPLRTEEGKFLVPKYSGKTHRAVTSYKVIGSNGNAALVELKPTTGVKHQLRVHLAFALGCPVIGDHKYSHLSKLAPQKLPSDVLQRLYLRQSKVRYLPMHLHSRGVSIPDVVEGRDIMIGARLPKHFKQNLERLKIRYKSIVTPKE